MSKKNNILIENAEIIIRNFSGKAGTFNPSGRRYFCVIIDEKVADTLKHDGWNVRYLKPKNEGDLPKPFLQVTVNFGYKPPKVVLMSSRGKSILKEEDVNILDWAEIERADILITPYDWNVGGAKGVKAYLKSLYVTIEENEEDYELERRYINVPDTAQNVIGGCGNCEECDGSCKEND